MDFKHPNKTRTAKMSAKVYSNIVKTHRIDWNYKPEPEAIISSSSVLQFKLLYVLIYPSILLILCNLLISFE